MIFRLHINNASLQMVHNVLSTHDLAHDLKQGIHIRSGLLLKQPIDPAEPVYLYVLDGKDPNPVPEGKPVKGAPPPPVGPLVRSGNDTVEILAALWQEVECICMDDAVFEADAPTVRQFAKVGHKRLVRCSVSEFYFLGIHVSAVHCYSYLILAYFLLLWLFLHCFPLE